MELANLERVKDLILTLAKAQRDWKSYPPKHPLLVKRREELYGKFDGVFATVPELPLRVMQDALLYAEKTVYQNADKRDSLAFNLHHNGVRELRFLRGMTRDEIDGFLTALNEDLDIDDSDEDLITLLWTRDLPHILYDAADDSDPRLAWARDPAGALRAYLQSQRELPGSEKFGAAIRFEGSKPPRDPRNDVNAIAISPDEAASVKRMIADDEKRDLILQVIEILLEVLRAGPDPQQARSLLTILEAVIEISVEERQFGRAATTMRAITELAPKVPQLDAALQGIVALLTEPKTIKTLVEVVSKGPDSGLPPIDEGDLFRYLTLLSRSAVVPLAEAMGVIEDRKIRKVFCEALAELVKNEPGQLAGLSRDNRWFVARNVAYILGLTKNPEALKILRSLASHSNEKVRAETLRGAAQMGIAAKDIVHRALVDPDRSVRILAFDLLGPFVDDSVPPVLLAQLSEKEYEPKDLAEKRALAMAAGRILRDHALAPLSVLLTRARRFGATGPDETRIAAAAGIAAIGSQMAADYLKQGVAAGEPTLKAACEQALREAKL